MAWEADAWDGDGLEERGEFGDMALGSVEKDQVSRVSGRGCSFIELSGTNFPVSQEVASSSCQPPDSEPVAIPSFYTGETKARESKGSFPKLPGFLLCKA